MPSDPDSRIFFPWEACFAHLCDVAAALLPFIAISDERSLSVGIEYVASYVLREFRQAPAGFALPLVRALLASSSGKELPFVASYFLHLRASRVYRRLPTHWAFRWDLVP